MTNANSTFTSQVFGETRHATEDERDIIVKAVTETPVTVFQELNKKLHALGYCISLHSLKELQ